MPPRSRKRKAYGIGFGTRKRRRVGSGRIKYHVRLRATGFKKRSSRRSRFKRRFRAKRRRFSRRKTPSQTALRFKLAEQRTVTFTYGQQHTVPNALNRVECVYFTTESTNTTHADRNETITVPLCGVNEICNIADYAWQTNPQNLTATVNAGWVGDITWGKLFVKAHEKQEIRNQSNEPVTLTAFTCRTRANVYLDTSAVEKDYNIYYYLGTGFAENGMDATNRTATNQTLTDSRISPFQSRFFCRHFKIVRVKRYHIQPGNILTTQNKTRWRSFQPADITRNLDTSTAFTARSKMYNNIRGEQFVLWKLQGNIGGIDGQATFEKNIGQTTPTVIMRTFRKYAFKHMPITKSPALTFAADGITTAATSIIVDSDEQKGAEIDAS